MEENYPDIPDLSKDEMEALHQKMKAQKEDSMLFFCLCIAIGYVLFVLSVFWKYVQPLIGK